MTQDEYDDLLTDEHYERRGRFASGPDDDPYPGLAKNVYSSPHEPDEDFDDSDIDIRFCDDCGSEVGPDLYCSACRMHERHREISRREMDSLAHIAALNKKLADGK